MSARVGWIARITASVLAACSLCGSTAWTMPRPPTHAGVVEARVGPGDESIGSARVDAPRGRVSTTLTRDTKVPATWWATRGRTAQEARSRYVASLPPSGFVEGQPAAQRLPQRAEVDTLVETFARLAESADPEIAAQALIAWARTDGAQRSTLRERALARFAGPAPTGARGGAIALCIADDAAARAALRWLVDAEASADSTRARTALATRDRAFAALALGAISDGADVDRLLDLVCAKGADRDVRSLAAIGLGRLIERDPVARDRALPRLLALLCDARESRSLRSLVPGILVRSGDAAARLRVVAALREPATIEEVRRAAAYALASIAKSPRSESEAAGADPVASAARAQLLRSAQSDDDAAVRQWATLALGEWARARGDDVRGDEALIEFHRRGLTGERVAAADAECRLLAAGMHAGVDPSVRMSIVTALRERAADSVEPALRTAAARALGLAGDPAAIDTLRRRLGAEIDPVATAAVIEALGVLRDARSRATIERLSVGAAAEPVRRAAASAAALLAGQHTVEVLLSAFAAARNEREQAAVARAIGALGDARALNPLQVIATDPSRSRAERAHAIAALGLLVDPRVGGGFDVLGCGLIGLDAPDLAREVLAFESP